MSTMLLSILLNTAGSTAAVFVSMAYTDRQLKKMLKKYLPPIDELQAARVARQGMPAASYKVVAHG